SSFLWFGNSSKIQHRSPYVFRDRVRGVTGWQWNSAVLRMNMQPTNGAGTKSSRTRTMCDHRNGQHFFFFLPSSDSVVCPSGPHSPL
ncbi:unnamed protein product, partial [Ectocarpus sp. 4 AP-2014]